MYTNISSILNTNKNVLHVEQEQQTYALKLNISNVSWSMQFLKQLVPADQTLKVWILHDCGYAK